MIVLSSLPTQIQNENYASNGKVPFLVLAYTGSGKAGLTHSSNSDLLVYIPCMELHVLRLTDTLSEQSVAGSSITLSFHCILEDME